MISVVIATHELVYGAPQALFEYVVGKNGTTKFIAHPLLDNSLASYEINYPGATSGKVVIGCNKARSNILIYLTQASLNVRRVIASKHRYDVYIGVNPINSIGGLILRILGIVKYNIYYTIDFSPKRFEGVWMNCLYHFLDNLCVRMSDETWNVSPAISRGRNEWHKLVPPPTDKQHVVPIGVWLDRVARRSAEQVSRRKIIFIGHLLEKQGVQLAVQAMSLLKASFPDVRLLIVGGGPYEGTLRSLVENTELSHIVTFTGWVKDRKEVDLIMADSAVAIATYIPDLASYSAYADPTKLKDYLSAAIPIVMTSVPYNAYELEAAECALVVSPTPQAVADALEILLRDDEKWERMKKASLNYIQRYEWQLIFDSALHRCSYLRRSSI